VFSHVEIQYANPINLDDVYTVRFKLKDHSLAQKWAKIVEIANKKYPIDAPNRFYGFSDRETQITETLFKINQTVDVINGFDPIIDRHLIDILDQDTLNYLHHIFEVYHGLLDQQTSEFWYKAPDNIKKALADLNIQVHECESIGRNKHPIPTHAVTWYKMPKVTKLNNEEYKLFELGSRVGTIYLLYVEIGKTLEDLSVDNDHYIFDSAFKPFTSISADFIVKYFNEDKDSIEKKHSDIVKYYNKHKEFFEERNLSLDHPYLTPGLIPVAEVEQIPNDLIDNLKSRQWVKSINLI
jgi:hypothetical protein